jgi:NTE family protein
VDEVVDLLQAGMPPAPTPDLALMGRVMELMAVPSTPDVVRQIADVALSAPAAAELAEEFVTSIERLLGGSSWPPGDLRVTAVDCESCQTRVWTAADGVALPRAVTSSIAVPTLLGPIGIDGRRYMDGGVTSPSHLDLLADAPVERAIFIGPLAGPAFPVPHLNALLERERDELVRRGIAVRSIVPGPGFEAVAMELMNPAHQDRAFELGVADGRRAAEDLPAFLAG